MLDKVYISLSNFLNLNKITEHVIIFAKNCAGLKSSEFLTLL